MASIYENFRAACKRHNTTLSKVLKDLGHSSGSTGAWKAGRPPKLDIVMEIADYLHISLDELVYGLEYVQQKKRQEATAFDLSDEQLQWLTILANIPEDRRTICLDFLKTHAVEPQKTDSDKTA